MIVRFEILGNFFMVNVTLHFRRLTVKNNLFSRLTAF